MTIDSVGSSQLAQPTRRAVVSGLTALAAMQGLVGCNRANPGWFPHRFYKYTLQIEVDGRPYDFSNGGVLAHDRDKTEGGAFFDFPMPATVALNARETLVVFPPPLGREWSRIASRMTSGQALQSISYPNGAFPSVFVFDDATTPRSVKGWITRAGLKSGKTRVRLLSVEAEVTATDMRVPVTNLPWYAPTQTAYRLYTDEGPQASQAYKATRKSLFADTNHGYVPARVLYAPVATIIPSADRNHSDLNGFDGAYAEIGQALSRGEPVQVPLRRSAMRDEPALSWAPNPLTFEFLSIDDKDHAWALRQKAMQDLPGRLPNDIFLRALGLKLTNAHLGSLKFAKQPMSFDMWVSEGGAMLMRVGHARLCLYKTAVDEVSDVAPSSDFGIALA